MELSNNLYLHLLINNDESVKLTNIKKIKIIKNKKIIDY